jgi:hypothetical protein
MKPGATYADWHKAIAKYLPIGQLPAVAADRRQRHRTQGQDFRMTGAPLAPTNPTEEPPMASASTRFAASATTAWAIAWALAAAKAAPAFPCSACSRRARDGASDEIEVGGDSVVRVELDNGFVLWSRVDDLSREYGTLPASAMATAPGSFLAWRRAG